jgi:lipoprotein-anchoring transpeptidase ErfK/SrfK
VRGKALIGKALTRLKPSQRRARVFTRRPSPLQQHRAIPHDALAMTPRTGLLTLLLPIAALAQTATPPPAGDANIAAYKAAQAGVDPQAPPPADTTPKPGATTPPTSPPPAGDAAIEAYKADQGGPSPATPPPTAVPPATTPSTPPTDTTDAGEDKTTDDKARTDEGKAAPTQGGADKSATPATAEAAAALKRDILHAQILLERARFSPGQIDGAGGGNTRRALAAFQRQQGLAESGELDDATWSALTAHAPALVNYTVTAEDVAGPFAAVPEDMMEKSTLGALGYADAAEALGEKFHASPALLQRLNPGKAIDVAGTTLLVPNVAGLAPPPKAARVVVDRSDASVSLVDAQGRTYARYPASTGSEHDPLPVGEWKINGVSLGPTFHYNPELFWDADPAHAKARIAPGPNNPVGVAWIDLSKPHYGIHGTPEPGTIGTSQSHGCIRVTNWSARDLAEAVAPGMPAVLQE